MLKSSNGILFQQRFFVIIVLRVGVEERFLTDDAFYLDALRRIIFILFEKRGHERQRIDKNFSLEI